MHNRLYCDPLWIGVALVLISILAVFGLGFFVNTPWVSENEGRIGQSIVDTANGLRSEFGYPPVTLVDDIGPNCVRQQGVLHRDVPIGNTTVIANFGSVFAPNVRSVAVDIDTSIFFVVDGEYAVEVSVPA